MFNILRTTIFALTIPCSVLAAREAHTLHFDIGDFAEERQVPVALLVTVKIDGRACNVQLDTGASNAFIANGASRDPHTSQVLVELGSRRSAYPVTEEAKRRIADCVVGSPVATLGNAFFDRGSIELDLASGLLTIDDSSVLKNDPFADPFRYAKWWGDTGGMILVEVGATGDMPSEAMLDTGAMRLDLGVLDRDTWQALMDPAAKMSEFTIPSWGKLQKCTQTVAIRPLILPGQTPVKPTVTFCPELGFAPAQPILGILGLRRFLKSRLIIDYQAQRWRVMDAMRG